LGRILRPPRSGLRFHECGLEGVDASFQPDHINGPQRFERALRRVRGLPQLLGVGLGLRGALLGVF
jgi:hypothetical protein